MYRAFPTTELELVHLGMRVCVCFLHDFFLNKIRVIVLFLCVFSLGGYESGY